MEVKMDGVGLHLCGSLHRGVQEGLVLEASWTQGHQSSAKGSDAASRYLLTQAIGGATVHEARANVCEYPKLHRHTQSACPSGI